MLVRIFSIVVFVFSWTNSNAQEIIQLYKESVPNTVVAVSTSDTPTIQIYLPESNKINGSAILIIPGGAYSFLAYEEEGTKIAQDFASKGITAFVLKYRMPNKHTMVDKSMSPLMDAQQGIKIIRDSAIKWNVNPNKVGVIGFSAGGHLASTLGTHFNKSIISNEVGTNLRPDFMILVYPLVSMEDSLTHLGSKISLLGMEPTETIVRDWSNELHVTKETPPTYLTHCEDDRVVDVKNSIIFYQALQKQGVHSKLHLVSIGGHGFIQHIPTSEWLDPILEFLTKEGFYLLK